MFIKCIVHLPAYVRDGRYYIDVKLDENTRHFAETEHLKSAHKLCKNGKVFNPLDDDILTLKIPFKWNRPTLYVDGLKTIFEYVKDDILYGCVEYNGVWNTIHACGMTWTLVSIKDLNA